MSSLFKGPRKPDDEERRKFTGDPEDYRLSLIEHLEELRDRIIRSMFIICIGWTIGWFAEPRLYGYLDTLTVQAVKATIPKNSDFKEVFHNIPEMFMLKLKLFLHDRRDPRLSVSCASALGLHHARSQAEGTGTSQKTRSC